MTFFIGIISLLASPSMRWDGIRRRGKELMAVGVEDTLQLDAKALLLCHQTPFKSVDKKLRYCFSACAF